jgi:mRNA deadenylase 3'-5' endonuclease subunit Ccr4
MVRNSTHDVESGASSNRKKGKTSLGLIIALAVALVAAIVFMSVFIVYQQKYVEAQNILDAKNAAITKVKAEQAKQLEKLKSMTNLSAQMLDTETSKRPDSTPVLMERKMIMGSSTGETPKVFTTEANDFKVMQFNMLADGLCGLYDDGMMGRPNQHVLYWRYRLPLIIDEIVRNKADIVTLQENDHPEVVKDALNVRAAKDAKEATCGAAKATECDCEAEDKWECEHKEKVKSKIAEMKNLPIGKNKVDSSTICWRKDKFEQDPEVKLAEAYETIDLKVDDNNNITGGGDQIFLAIKLQHKESKKDVIIVTTQLETEKTLYGEIIRLHQSTQLMKKIDELKKAHPIAAVILAADLGTTPANITNVDTPTKADKRPLIEKSMIEGKKWNCQVVTGRDHVLVPDSIAKGHEFKATDIEEKDYKFEITFKEEKYALYKHSSMFYANHGTKANALACSDNEKMEEPHTFLRFEDFSGKTFYDRFNEKYEIQAYESAVNLNKIKMLVNGADYWIEKDEANTYFFKTPQPNSVTYSLNKRDTEWVWSNNTDRLNLSWSTEKYNPYKISNFPAATYTYVTGVKFDDSRKAANKDFVDNLKVFRADEDTSAVDATKKTFLELTAVKDYLKTMLTEYATKTSPIVLTSSQKAVNTKEPNTEPKFTSYINRYTEDYIFNNEELKPVGSLSFPVMGVDDRTEGFPASDYPSDHLSIMTQYRFA